MSSVQVGTVIGSYEIRSLIGKGGMGEVYRASDTKLKRDVAIKALPAEFSGDPERLARFQREAEALAALNHPNIGNIYHLQESDGSRYLVLELIEGDTLSELLAKRGALPLDETLSIAKQICEALEAAHEKGITHRDLKPANIKITADGKTKLLDFGLARMFESTPAANLSNSPTLFSQSIPGMIIGTAAYMSPEQAKGRAADRVSDIWAFGCVLYEMLTGRPAFPGETVSEVFAGIIKGEPDWNALPPETPAPIRRLLGRCLRKDARKRLQSIADARIEILDYEEGGTEESPVQPTTRPSTQKYVLIGALAGALVIAAIFSITNLKKSSPSRPVVRFDIVPPGDHSFSALPPRFSVSPNGRYVVFPLTGGAGKPAQLWLRRVDSTEATPVAGTEATAAENDPQSPFWSPDSRHIGYFVTSNPAGAASLGASKLKKVDLDGGPVQTLCELPSNNGGGTWNSEGVILVSTQGSKGILRIPETGGVPVPVTTLQTEESAHLWPKFLPDGRHFLFQSQVPAHAELWAVYVGSTDSKDRSKVVGTQYMAQFVNPDLLLYLRGESLLAQHLSLKTFSLVGEPALIAKSVVSNNSNGRPGFSASDDDVLAYTTGPSTGETRQISSTDRGGRPTVVANLPTMSLRLSPDGNRFAYYDISGGLWTYDLNRGIQTRLTTASGPGTTGSPVWAPDGKKIAFEAVTAGGESALYQIPTNAAGPPERIFQPEAGITVEPLDWSPDGKFLLFRKARTGLVSDLWIIPAAGGTPSPYLVSGGNKGTAAFSPDGRWLAYTSNENGIPNIFIQPFPDASLGKWQLSSDGGTLPRWKADSHEIYYFNSLTRNVVAVRVKPGNDFVIEKPIVLFNTPLLGANGSVTVTRGMGPSRPFDASPDGQRFLLSLPVYFNQQIPLTVMLNWRSAIEKQ